MTKASENKINLIKQVMRVTGTDSYIVGENEDCIIDPVERKLFLNYWKNHGFKIRHRRHLGYVLC